ncbi:glycoside hydrolase family 127 protein, partial [Paenibacillus sepulcri]|nr:glycoside hydrolase family 127 protein [Paenibacillus sepulcri]
ASLGQYIYGTQDRTLYTHLYIGSRLKWQLDDQHVLIEQNSRYTQEGTVSFRVVPESPVSFRLALRIPDWCGEAACLVNGIPLELDELVEDGYAVINRLWEAGDTVDLTFSMPVLRMKGHPHIRQTAGKTAIQRGPFVYCLEEADNGPDLHQIVLPEGSRLEASPEAQPAGGIPHITGQALRRGGDEWNGALYRSGVSGQSKPVEVTFIPYYTWANRGAGEMAVWIRD